MKEGLTRGSNLHAYIKRDVKRVNGSKKIYRYFRIRDEKKRIILSIPVEDLMKLLLTLKKICKEKMVVRGVGFEPTQAYAIGS